MEHGYPPVPDHHRGAGTASRCSGDDTCLTASDAACFEIHEAEVASGADHGNALSHMPVDGMVYGVVE
jgi:hypothetical protein